MPKYAKVQHHISSQYAGHDLLKYVLTASGNSTAASNFGHARKAASKAAHKKAAAKPAEKKPVQAKGK